MVRKHDATVSVRLSKTQIEIIAPALDQLVASHRVREGRGTSPFAYPFRIYPPPRGFDRGKFDKVIMEKILSLTGTLKMNRNGRRWVEMDTFQLRAAVFAVRSQIEFVCLLRRQHQKDPAIKAALHADDESVAHLKAEAQPVIRILERYMKRANRALMTAIEKDRYDLFMAAWKAHLRWMRLHIAYYKPLGKRTHGRRKRQQRDLDELMEMAKLAVRSEGHQTPGKMRFRHLMRLYARYSRSGRPGYWSVRTLLENKDTYRAQWNLAQFVIKRFKP